MKHISSVALRYDNSVGDIEIADACPTHKRRALVVCLRQSCCQLLSMKQTRRQFFLHHQQIHEYFILNSSRCFYISDTSERSPYILPILICSSYSELVRKHLELDCIWGVERYCQMARFSKKKDRKIPRVWNSSCFWKLGLRGGGRR